MTATDGLFTVNEAVTSAARRSGVQGLGQILAGDDVLDIQNELSYMLAQWNTKTWLVWDKIDLGVVSTGQITGYTIGPGGQYNVILRPDRVEAAYIRILTNSGQPVDQPLELIPSAESYSEIALKQLVAFSKGFYYQPSTPLGQVFFYPWPQASIYEMHIIIKDQFPLALPLNTDLSTLPPVARAAIIYNLARRVRQAFGKGLRPDPELNSLAKDSLETMRMSQIQSPQLTMPALLRRPSHYNIYGDITY